MATIRIAALLAALALAGCGADAEREAVAQSPQPPRTYEARGVTVTLPPGWHAATESLTPALTEPREVLVVATFPPQRRDGGCAHVAGALGDLGPSDALVTLLERGYGSDRRVFPQRPERFGPELGGPSEASQCEPGARFDDHWFTFADGARHFHVLVAFGPQAGAATRAEAWGVLDGLRVDPEVRPDWRAAP